VASESVLRSSGTGVTDRSGNEPGEFVSSSICLGDSLRTFADSEVEGVGEVNPPLVPILRFSFLSPFVVIVEEVLSRESNVVVTSPKITESCCPAKSLVVPCSDIGDSAGVTNCPFDGRLFSSSMLDPFSWKSLMMED